MTNVNKKPEFEEFLKLIEENTIPDTWEMVAKALGVHQNTITQWRKTPEFQKALASGIKNAVNSMERAGRSDWRMWREKISLLTKEKEQEKNQSTVLVIPSELIGKYGITPNTKDSSAGQP